jgi:dCTP diphosphatase
MCPDCDDARLGVPWLCLGGPSESGGRFCKSLINKLLEPLAAGWKFAQRVFGASWIKGVSVEIEEIRDELRRFAADREWDQFHSPKNLATALTIEAAELLEHFQWLTDDQSLTLSPEVREQVVLEMADVFLYLVRLADRLDANLIDAARQKLAINAQRYPVSLSKGSAKKYKDY